MQTMELPLNIEPASKAEAKPQPTTADMDEAAVRAAVLKAEAEGKDPAKIPVSALAQGSEPSGSTPDKPAQIPDKFKTADGGVDVEKLKASTEALQEGIQQKQEKLEKTVEDYLKEYRELENKFRTMPNPQKLEANLRQETPPPAPPQMTDEQLRAKLSADFQRDFVGTTTDLIDIIVERRMKEKMAVVEEPLRRIVEDQQTEKMREAIKAVAEKDSRVLQSGYYNAIQEKLKAEPDYWKLKNPFRSAWNDVKDEMRLDDSPKASQAQSSKPASPILGGGTPPPTPSQGTVLNLNNFEKAVQGVNLRDPREMDALEKAAKELFKSYR